ncbi:hypothetical protein GW17_00013202 [Ensete ventricosum]|nr:hypothetical protein GW17_00013202 [Ensete ventricosum]
MGTTLACRGGAVRKRSGRPRRGLPPLHIVEAALHRWPPTVWETATSAHSRGGTAPAITRGKRQPHRAMAVA